MKGFFEKYQVPVFCVFNLAVTFVLVVVLGTEYIPQWMPGVSSILLTGFLLKSRGVSELCRRLRVKKQDIKWYLPAVFIPFFISVISYVVISFTVDIPIPETESCGWYEYGMVMGLILLGSIGEEIGWRGYLLPNLIRRNSFFRSNLIIGCVWGVWHFMVDAGSLVFCTYILLCVETSICMGWLWSKTHGSVIPAIIYHTVINFCAFVFFQPLFMIAGGDALFLLFGVQVLLLLLPCFVIVRFSMKNPRATCTGTD